MNVRLTPEQLRTLDAYIEQQSEPINRPEAIRRLVEIALKAST